MYVFKLTVLGSENPEDVDVSFYWTGDGWSGQQRAAARFPTKNLSPLVVIPNYTGLDVRFVKLRPRHV